MVRDHSVPQTEIELLLEREKCQQRLDLALHQKFPHRSRSYFQKIIRNGKVLVNDKTVRPSHQVQWKDKILININISDSWVDPSNIPLEILFENNDLVAVNKAPWQIVHPTGQTQGGTVLNALHARHNNNDGHPKNLPKVLHRLDQETSGVLVFAKGTNAGYYGQLFEQRKTTKTYLALLEGQMKKNMDCRKKIGKHPTHLIQMAQTVTTDGKEAISFFQPLFFVNGLTFCKIKIETGRLHQIRVHAAHLTYPVFGDSLYNPKDEDIIRWTEGEKPQCEAHRPKRQLLHAYTLELPLINGKKLTIKAPLPKDFMDWGGIDLANFWKKNKDI